MRYLPITATGLRIAVGGAGKRCRAGSPRVLDGAIGQLGPGHRADGGAVAAQLRCRVLQGPKFKISSLRITAAKPAEPGRAAVWLTVNATAQVAGQTVPVARGGAASTDWFVATEIGGAWYADLSNSGSGALPPCPQ